MKQVLLVTALVLALRLPFLNQAIQGDDLYYLYGAEHAQIEPLHPNHTQYLFRGEMGDMRGHSHPPLNSWILGGLLAAMGDIKEVPFHLAYTLFSWIAAMAMLALARRFTEHPLLATALFCAVPAFVVNGNSLEADLPFLAFWMAAMARFVDAVERDSLRLGCGSAVASGSPRWPRIRAIFLTPILALYVYQRRRDWLPGWVAALSRAGGVGGVADLGTGHHRGDAGGGTGGLHAVVPVRCLAQTLRGAAALVVHLAWMVSPVILLRCWCSAGRGACGSWLGLPRLRRRPTIRIRCSGSPLRWGRGYWGGAWSRRRTGASRAGGCCCFSLRRWWCSSRARPDICCQWPRRWRYWR